MTRADEVVTSFPGHCGSEGPHLGVSWPVAGAAPRYSSSRLATVRRSIAGARSALLAMRLDEDASTTSQLRCMLRDRSHPTLGGCEAAVRVLHACILAVADDFVGGRNIDRNVLALLEGLYRALPKSDAQLTDLRPWITHLLRSAALGASDEPAPTSFQTLSRREIGIVRMIAHGMSNKRIAKSLGITPETVKSHAKHIFVKLGARTRAQAVARAEATGLLKPALVPPINAPSQTGSRVFGQLSAGSCS